MSKAIYEEMFTDMFKHCFEILEHYKCPESCNAYCCRNSVITFGDFDARNILRMYPAYEKTIESDIKKEDFKCSKYETMTYQFTKKPCPLLSEYTNLCYVQSVKPIVCRLYPFTVNKGEGKGNVALDPCPMGIEITKDFVLMRIIMTCKCFDEDSEEARQIIARDLASLDHVINEARKFTQGGKLPMVYVPLEITKIFASFLETSTVEDRMHDKIEAGIEESDETV